MPLIGPLLGIDEAGEAPDLFSAIGLRTLDFDAELVNDLTFVFTA